MRIFLKKVPLYNDKIVKSSRTPKPIGYVIVKMVKKNFYLKKKKIIIFNIFSFI